MRKEGNSNMAEGLSGPGLVLNRPRAEFWPGDSIATRDLTRQFPGRQNKKREVINGR